jgi:hypothetical protein
MRKITILFAILVAFTNLMAQTGKVKPYKMMNTMTVKPKRGQETQFEDAVKAHIAKFHPTGTPTAARLSVITEGQGSDGWYVWAMGPLMYTDLDNQPQGKKDHDDDWSANVDVHVEAYGESMFWKLQEQISYTPANYNPDNIDVWTIDIKPGMRPQFEELMKKWKAMWDAKKYPFSLRVFYNDLWNSDGKDVSIVYSFANYAEFDLDISWKNDYNDMYGKNSWDEFWKEWNTCVNSTGEHLRKFIK